MSGPFRFPLEKVLELRMEEEQQQAKLMADARRDAKAAREAVRNLEALRKESRQRLAQAHSAGRSVGQLRNLEWILQRMDSELGEAEGRASDADREAGRRLKEFQEAVMKRQSLDKLRERKHAAWSEDERLRDRKAMDDAALTRYVRAGDRLLAEGTEAP